MYAYRQSILRIRSVDIHRLLFITSIYIFVLLLRWKCWRNDFLAMSQASSIRLRLLIDAVHVIVRVHRLVVHIPYTFPLPEALLKMHMRLKM